eukprot:m.247703 g.247703  ORF g.247703 m.247703 type:complete len:963 (+) comp16129_c0_seq2:125-3013(+)
MTSFSTVILVVIYFFTTVNGSVLFTEFNNTALAPPVVHNSTVNGFGFGMNVSDEGVSGLPVNTSARWQANVRLNNTDNGVAYLLFSIHGDGGYVRLRVDDQLLIDTRLQSDMTMNSFVAPSVGESLNDGGPVYTEWQNANIDTPGHTMASDGGDCQNNKCGSLDKCVALCEQLAVKGCIGFVTDSNKKYENCYMRKLKDASDTCQNALEYDSRYVTFTANKSCHFPPGWSPSKPPSPPSPSVARFAVPVPFFPSATTARIDLEYTATDSAATFLQVFVNGTDINTAPGILLDSNIQQSQLIYQNQSMHAETGWNTWLSGDMLTHAFLPNGIAAAMTFEANNGKDSISNLGNNGPKCNRNDFPATHGLHDTRGEYTEIITLDFNGGQFHIETATDPNDETSLVMLITTLSPCTNSDAMLTLNVDVPPDWLPRICSTSGSTTMSEASNGPIVIADCPGYESIQFSVVSSTTKPLLTKSSIQIPLGTVKANDKIIMTAGTTLITNPSTAMSIVSQRRAALQTKIANNKYGVYNETYAGLMTAISWNVIYTPYEGIFTPVFRGSPWAVSRPHNYVLFEWDTFFAALIAAKVDSWVAKNNVIRMVKSLIADPFKGGSHGYVAGFWNGLCGEVDKSKPPVGGIALQKILEEYPEEMWMGDLLIDQFMLWNRWWQYKRLRKENSTYRETSKDNMNGAALAPGSSREMMTLPISCTTQNPIVASRCETGLDNSPLYDHANFITSSETIDQSDVGMTALYAADSQALANISLRLGLKDYATELTQRQTALQTTLNTLMWKNDSKLYFNRNWVQGNFSSDFVVAPTNFYPMITGTPSESQVTMMMERWFTNSSEMCVSSACNFSTGSVSRSCPAFGDNSYWRGRSWGPMNYLLYLGLLRYSSFPSVQTALKRMATQTENTFLVEWVPNRRVMENYNSVSGVGCDVGNAIPFYHWGALNALLPVLEKERTKQV